MLSFKDYCKLEESIRDADLLIHSEKTEKGYRPKISHKHEPGKTAYLSGVSYKTAEHAKNHAEAYLNAYTKIGPKAADRAGWKYRDEHKEHVVESVELDEAEGLTTKKNRNGGHDVYHNDSHIGHVEVKSIPWLRGKTMQKVVAKNANGDAITIDSDATGKNTVESAKKTLLKLHLSSK